MASPETCGTAGEPERTPAASRRPGSLAVEVTARCNRACSYCYNVWKAGSDSPPEELSAPQLVSMITNVMADSGLGTVQVTGGEPFLRPDLIAIIEGIRAAGAGVAVVTDGGLIDDELAATLARLRVGRVQPTLLAADRNVHNSMKGADCFDATVAAIGRLLRSGVPVSAAFVCTRHNHHHFRDVVELCYALGVKQVAFSRFCAAGEGGRRHAELMPSRSMIAACLDVAQWAKSRLGMDVHLAISLPLCGLDLRRYPALKFGRCAVASPRPGFTLDPAGNLRACSISPTLLGNLRQEPWRAILDRAQEGYFKQMATVPLACRGCFLLARCGGGCRESTLTCFGTLSRPDPLARPPVNR